MDDVKIWLDNDVFLGRGWSFPPVLTENGIKMSAYEQDIQESLRVLFSTSPGERVSRYDYGCDLRQYAFEPLSEQLTIRMRNEITHAVSFKEQPEQGVLLIHLTYTILRTNNRNNMVYPFYLREGTNVNV